MDVFSVRLKELRKNKAVSQKEISKAINISDRAYSDFECGRSKPAYETLFAICQYFQVPADYLLGLSDKKELD